MIYLTSEEQEKILSMFHFALNFNSYLFLGPSESISSLTDMFKITNSKAKLFHYLSGVTSKKMKSTYNYSRVISRNEKRINNEASETPTVNQNRNYLLFEDLLEEILPHSILIDSEFNLIHIFNGAGKYMEISDGKISLNILKMFNKNTRFIIESLIIKSKKENHVESSIVPEDELEIKLSPINDSNYFLISFQKNQNIEKTKYHVIDINENMKERINSLENQLIKKEDDLQSTIQQLETSNEELQSANEQLISSNEELQSTNEKLQSVNEELYTVNSEYQNKIEELTDANNDLNNYLNANNIGTIFLDKNLKIRKFTPSSKIEFSLMKVDLGRPIYHITHNFEYNGLYDDCKKVVENMNPIEKYLSSKENKSKIYLLRILPYLTGDNVMKGIIITFLDITDIRKHNTEDLNLMNLSSDIYIILRYDGYFISANNKFFDYLGIDEKYIDKNSFFSLIDNDYRKNIIEIFEESINSSKTIEREVKFKNTQEVLKIKFGKSENSVNCFIKIPKGEKNG